MAGIQDLIVWTDPIELQTKYGRRLVRSWAIPVDLREGFMLFWKKNGETLKTKGYTIGKNNVGELSLFEWRKKSADFRMMIGKDNPEQIIPTVSSLPMYNLKYSDGLRPWQTDVVSRLVSSIKVNSAAIDGSDTGCHEKGQPILMFDGSIKLVEEIVVGDSVMGWDGTPRMVTSLSRGQQEMARVVPTKGDSFVVNMDHILTVKLTNPPTNHRTTSGFEYGKIYDIKVSDYLRLSSTTRHSMKLFSCGVDSWKHKSHIIDPYFLGVLLGDDGLTSKSITLTSADNEIWNYVSDKINVLGGKLGNTENGMTKRLTFCPVLLSEMRRLKLLPIKCNDRFIPDEYKIDSRENRLRILAGLIDTDGSYGTGSFYFTSKSITLRNDVAFLARSLGYLVTTKTRICHCMYKGIRKYGTYHQLTIIGNVSEIPTKIQRKKAPRRRIKKDPLVRGFSIMPMEKQDFYGFSLTGDGRFLLGDFTVTHNTGKSYSAVAVARELGMGIAVICPKAVITPWTKIIVGHFNMKPTGVINYESLKTGKHEHIGRWENRSKTSTSKKFVWTLPKNTLIVFDESHRLKGNGTQNSEMAIEAKRQGYKILCCSATNAIDPIELKAVGFILNLYKSGKWTIFLKDHGCEQGMYGWEFTGNKKILSKLHADIFLNRGIRLKKDDIPGFPENEIIAEAYNIDPSSEGELRSIYAEMENELIELNHKSMSTAEWKVNAMTVRTRVLQKAELVKIPLFVEMAEEAIENGMSVVIFVNYTDTIRALSKRLKTNCIVWGENKNQEERDANIADFQNDRSRIILVNIKAGGAGLSLHQVTSLYPRLAIVSPTPSAVDLRQVLGRIHRDGSKSKSIQKIVFVANTKEEETCESVKRKLDQLDMINDGDLE